MSSCILPRSWLVITLLAAALCLRPGAGAATELRLRMETGTEIDTNATRTESANIASFVLRGSADLALTTQLSAKHVLLLQELVGAKKFLSGNVGDFEDVVATSTAATLASRLSQRFSSDLRLTYYDAFQRAALTGRDFRTGAFIPRLQMVLTGSLRGGLLAGYRAFQYKPDGTQSNWGPLVGGQLTWRKVTGELEMEHEWELGLSYQFQHRTFDGPNIQVTTPGAPAVFAPGTTHIDRFHFSELYGQYTGLLLASLSYGFQWNDSSSYGYGFLRHLVTLRLATVLFSEITAAVRVGLQVLSLDEDLAFDPQIPESIDHENRTFVESTLSIPLTDSFALLLRYAYYTSSLGTQALSTYSRHVGFLGLEYELGR